MNEETQTETLPVKLEVFIDFVCPWCYLAHAVVEQLRREQALEVSWSPFPLHPETPPEGLLLDELFAGADLDAMHQRLYAMMDELGLEHCERERLFNTRRAQELALWAVSHGDGKAGETLVGLLFRAYFVDNRNLADETVLLDLVEAAGLDRDEAARVLAENSFAGDVDEAWQRARQYRINGVPAFVGGGYQFSGYQPQSEMERFLNFVREQQTA